MLTNSISIIELFCLHDIVYFKIVGDYAAANFSTDFLHRLQEMSSLPGNREHEYSNRHAVFSGTNDSSLNEADPCYSDAEINPQLQISEQVCFACINCVNLGSISANLEYP